MNSYKDCMNFDCPSCEYKDHDIMIIAKQNIPQYHDKLEILDFPFDKDIDSICSECKSFKPKKISWQ